MYKHSLIPYQEKSVYENGHTTPLKHIEIMPFVPQTSTKAQSMVITYLGNTFSLITFSLFVG